MKEITRKKLQRKGAKALRNFLEIKQISPTLFASFFDKQHVNYWLDICVPITAAVEIVTMYNDEIALYEMRPDLFKKPSN